MKSKIVLAALALGLLSSTANAGILYDRYNRPFVVNSSCAGMLNVIKVYNATGYIGHIRDYGRGASQSWDARGRPLFHTYARY